MFDVECVNRSTAVVHVLHQVVWYQIHVCTSIAEPLLRDACNARAREDLTSLKSVYLEL